MLRPDEGPRCEGGGDAFDAAAAACCCALRGSRKDVTTPFLFGMFLLVFSFERLASGERSALPRELLLILAGVRLVLSSSKLM